VPDLCRRAHHGRNPETPHGFGGHASIHPVCTLSLHAGVTPGPSPQLMLEVRTMLVAAREGMKRELPGLEAPHRRAGETCAAAKKGEQRALHE
jgi:hypothetical protein